MFFTCACGLYVVLLELCYMYVRTQTWIAAIANMGQLYVGMFIQKYKLPEAIFCCLHVDVVLFVMYCMCIPAVVVNSADVSQLWVYLLWYTA